MRTSSLTRFAYTAAVLALLVPLAGCGGEADAGASDLQPSSNLTLAGPLTADGTFDLDCNVYSDRGLQVTFATPDSQTAGEGHGEGGHALQIQIRANDFLGSGEYPVGVVINEHEEHGFKRWNGWATASIKSSLVARGGIQDHSVVSGTFEGTYQGQGKGQGTIRGSFQNCTTRELIP